MMASHCIDQRERVGPMKHRTRKSGRPSIERGLACLSAASSSFFLSFFALMGHALACFLAAVQRITPLLPSRRLPTPPPGCLLRWPALVAAGRRRSSVIGSVFGSLLMFD